MFRRRRRYEEKEGTRRVEAEGGAMRRKRGRAGCIGGRWRYEEEEGTRRLYRQKAAL